MNTPPYGQPALDTPLLQARDRIYETLMHRLGLQITEPVARDAANNAATALLDLLMPNSTVVRGEINSEMGKASPTESRYSPEGGRAPDDGGIGGSNPPSLTPGAQPAQEYEETTEEMARRVIK